VSAVAAGSYTLTTLVAVALLPDESETSYVTVYFPALSLSTLSPDTLTLSVMSPSQLSVAVYPGSLYLSPFLTDIKSSPESFICGAVVSVTCTVLLTSLSFFDESATLYFIS